MAVSPVVRQQSQEGRVTVGEYEELEGEYKACQQHLRSKEQALRILQEQLKKADLNAQRLKQEIKQLRSQLSRSQQVLSPVSKDSSSTKSSFSLLNEELIQEKEVLIQQLEGAQGNISELERQVKELEDEKDELSGERDHFSAKCDSLLKCLEEEKTRQPPTHSAVQGLLTENRQLKLALVEAEAQKDHIKGKMERYKRAIERRTIVEAAGEQVMNSVDKKQDLKLAVKRISELESLANSLSQSVKEKSVTITHQKKANKVLATKVAELEHQLKAMELSSLWSSANNADAVSTSQCQCIEQEDLKELAGSHLQTPAVPK